MFGYVRGVGNQRRSLTQLGHARLATPPGVPRYLMNPWDVLTLINFWVTPPPGQTLNAFQLLSSVTWTIVQPDYRVDYQQYPINRVRGPARRSGQGAPRAC